MSYPVLMEIADAGSHRQSYASSSQPQVGKYF